MRFSTFVTLTTSAVAALDGHQYSDVLQPQLNPVPKFSGYSGNGLGNRPHSTMLIQNLQPNMNSIPVLSSNFSTDPASWPHSTPLLQNPKNLAPDQFQRRAAHFWNGWSSVAFLFAFGDSYTSTNFTISGEQPSPRNPLGNPAYPGATSSDGPNFIDFMTTTYNQSYVQTYNFAYGGAVVNDSVIKNRFGINVQSFVDQVELEFLPTYVNNSNVPWESSNSLFSVFFGINDVTNSYLAGDYSLNYEVIQSYQNIVNELYSLGARNFLFLNVPPVDRSPATLGLSKANQTAEAAYIGAYNFRLGALVYNLGLRYPDTMSFIFDTNLLFTAVLDDPLRFEEISQFKNVTDFCTTYAQWAQSGFTESSFLEPEITFSGGTPSLTYYDPACGVPIDEYFWLNDLHPTYAVHNFMGSQITQLLESNP